MLRKFNVKVLVFLSKTTLFLFVSKDICSVLKHDSFKKSDVWLSFWKLFLKIWI